MTSAKSGQEKTCAVVAKEQAEWWRLVVIVGAHLVVGFFGPIVGGVWFFRNRIRKTEMPNKLIPLNVFLDDIFLCSGVLPGYQLHILCNRLCIHGHMGLQQ